MGELVGLLFFLLGAYGLNRTYRGMRRGAVYYYIWSHGLHREEIRRDSNPQGFCVHIIVPIIVNLCLVLFGLAELFLGDVFLI